jgi:hypothetical protein
LSAGKAEAQKKGVMNLPSYNNAPYHFGFILAINEMSFIIKMKDNFQNITFDSLQSPDIYADSLNLLRVDSKPTLGFTVGIVGDLPIGRFFDLRLVPSLGFGERYLDYYMKTYNDGTPAYVQIRKNITSAHIDVPIYIKYRSKRAHNFAAYVQAGVKYVLDLAATRVDKEEEGNETVVKLMKNDIAALAGVGVEFYNGWFKFGIEIMMSYGLTDLLRHEDDNIYTGGIESLHSRVFQLSFSFE